MLGVKYKVIILFVLIFLAANFFGLSKPDCYDKIIPENLSLIQKDCPKLFENLVFCVADHGECLKNSEKVAECNFSFLKCAEKSRTEELTEACEEFLSNSVDHIRRHGGRCLREQVYEVVEEIQSALFPITSILFNSTTISSLSPISENFGSLTNFVELFVPFLQDISLNYREDAEVLEAALLAVDAKTIKSLEVPLALWNGGFGQKGMAIGKVLDRVLVTSCCGHNVAQKINHAWARCADCLAKSKTSSCTSQLIVSLEEISVESIKSKTICDMYVKAIKSFAHLIMKSSHGEQLFQYVDADRILNEETTVGMLRSSHLHLLKLTSSESLSYRQCYSVKRQLSSCEYSYKVCEKNFGTNCDELLSDCHLNIVDADPECRKTLVHSRNFTETITAWFWFIVNNPLLVIGCIIGFVVTVCSYISCVVKGKDNTEKIYGCTKTCWEKKKSADIEMEDMSGVGVIPSEGDALINNNSNNNNNDNGSAPATEQEQNDKKLVRFWSWEFWRNIRDRVIQRFQ